MSNVIYTTKDECLKAIANIKGRRYGTSTVDAGTA